MLTLTHAISYLNTSNLPWFMDLTFQAPMKYCSLQHQTLLSLPDTSTTGCCFCWAQPFHFFGGIFLLFFSSILGTYGPGKFIFQCPIFCLFLLLKWFARPVSHGPRFVRTLRHDPSVLSVPTWHGSQFHWVRQGCDLCISLVSFLWLWFRSKRKDSKSWKIKLDFKSVKNTIFRE